VLDNAFDMRELWSCRDPGLIVRSRGRVMAKLRARQAVAVALEDAIVEAQARKRRRARRCPHFSCG
jgi:hypothetical protein